MIYMAIVVITMTIAFYTSLTNVMIAAVVLLIYAAFHARRLWQHAERRAILIGAGVGIVLTIACALPGLLQLARTDADWQIGWQDTEQHSPDLVDFVMPTTRAQSTGRGEAYLGWLLLGMTAVGVTVFRTSASTRWAGIAAVLLLLSMGPTLHIGGSRVLPGWMPYRWLYELVPYFNLARTPTRLVVGAQWALAIVATFAIDGWTSAMRNAVGTHWRRWITAAATVVATVAIGLEFASSPIALMPMDVPPVYAEVVADDNIRVICDLPIRQKLQISNWYMYWQTYHGRRAVNGYFTHHSRGADALIARIKTWEGLSEANAAELRAAGVDAAVIHQPDQPGQLIRLYQMNTTSPAPEPADSTTQHDHEATEP